MLHYKVSIGKLLSAHVLTASSKFLWAYNVKSSSTNFSDNIQWNFEISFPYVILNNQLGYNLITESWDYQEWYFSDPCIIKLKKHSFKYDILLWKTLIRVSVKFKMYQDRFDNKYVYLEKSRTFVKVETNKVLHESGFEVRHLVARFETAYSKRSRSERVGSQNF